MKVNLKDIQIAKLVVGKESDLKFFEDESLIQHVSHIKNLHFENGKIFLEHSDLIINEHASRFNIEVIYVKKHKLT